MVVLQKFSYQCLDVINRGVGLPDGVFVLSVEICPGQVTPGVADNDSIRVEHGNNFEDVMFP